MHEVTHARKVKKKLHKEGQKMGTATIVAIALLVFVTVNVYMFYWYPDLTIPMLILDAIVILQFISDCAN